MTAPVFLSESSLARRWGVNKETVRRLRLAGKLRYYTPTGAKAIRYRLTDVETYERDCEHDAVVVGLRPVKVAR